MQEFVDKKTGETTSRVIGCYACPKNNCRIGTVSVVLCLKGDCRCVKVPENTGFTNPHRHLLGCFGRGKPASERETDYIALYRDAVEKSKRHGGKILSHFASNRLTEFEQELFAYVRFVTVKNFPISMVRDDEI